MASVTIKNLTKRYGNVIGVRSFNLAIQDGECIVFVGPSGCGKTTTLRMIAGLEDVQEGEIYIGDRLVNDLAPKDRNISMVFQNYALYPHMNVFKNMAFGLKLRKVPKPEIEKRVRNAAAILGLEKLLDRKPKQLSGGQMQRVAVGRAIVRDPEVFLFDEPLSNLDAKLRIQMRIELAKLHHRLSTTMIYVTHDQVEAMTLGDRIVVMKDGLIQQVGSPLEVYEHPSNLFVAGFVGSPSMNFMEGTLGGDGDRMVFRHGDLSFTIPSSKADKLIDHLNKPITLGIRPDHVSISKEKAGEGVETFVSKAELVETLGSETLVTATVAGSTLIAKLPRVADVSFGDSIILHFDLEGIHFFSSETGVRLGDEGPGTRR